MIETRDPLQGAQVCPFPEGVECIIFVCGRARRREPWGEDAMKRLVEFPSESGEPVLVEVEDLGLGGETRRGLSTSAVVERAQTSFEDALEKARPMALGLVGKLRAIGDAAGNPPDEVQVEFGLILSAEAGAVLAAASAGANYKVTMTWKRQTG
jgi:Trypsin-co-occurring domain 1